MPLPVTLGEHLKKRRLDLELLQAEAAKAAGIPLGSFKPWEQDDYPPRVELWPSIITFLGYDPRPVPSEFGERLAWFRHRIGLGQRAMAKALRTSVTTFWEWENCGSLPPAKAMAKLRGLARVEPQLPFSF